MRSRFTALTVAAASALALTLGTPAATTATAAAYRQASATGNYIVVLEDGALPGPCSAAHADRFGFDLGHVYSSALQGYSAAMTAADRRAPRGAARRRLGPERHPGGRPPRRPPRPASTGSTPT